jgi:uncharacterized protein (DUF849 family)
MIVQACLNGARKPGFHPALPLSPDDVVRAGVASVAAGAAELHVHPRGPDGLESLAPEAIEATIRALRARLPGTAVGVSTGAWIERDVARTRALIGAWRTRPDYASVNLAEPDAPAVIGLLLEQGIGVEAGLATRADGERLAGLGVAPRMLRLLVEIRQPAMEAAMAEADALLEIVGGMGRPILLHAFDDQMWPFIARAAADGYSTRVGLEDGAQLPDGTPAPDNAALVAAACAMMRPRMI